MKRKCIRISVSPTGAACIYVVDPQMSKVHQNSELGGCKISPEIDSTTVYYYMGYVAVCLSDVKNNFGNTLYTQRAS